ncbi:MAG: GH3 auxin-responsive promoter family protein [Bacteroidetes bacterium]|nr:GH3 auxin-responsive promoter family protein [Bacteroidota bacterium]
MAIFNSVISWYFKTRSSQLEYMQSHAPELQENIRRKLLKMAEDTEFGRKYDFENCSTIFSFREKIPINTYETLYPYIERMMHGEQNILWGSDIKWFAKSSGTTNDKSKFIPVSFESLELCHFRAGKDVLTNYCSRFENTEIFSGKGLVLGGSHQVNNMNEDIFFGDLSAVLLENMPFLGEILKAPKNDIALLSNWEEKLEKIVSTTIKENITSITGVPTWTIILMERVLEVTGAKTIAEVWPNFELYIHGGVGFVPYKERFLKLAGKPINFLENYNASEGFFGMQDLSTPDELFLMPDYDIYYEFMPMDQYGKDHPRLLSLEEVKLDEVYALVISTNAGLWRYCVGDTIRFTSLYPFRIKITGRTRLFINAFGEELMIENAEQAIKIACNACNCSVKEYTAAPKYFSEQHDAGHEWLIEFEKEPADMRFFNTVLDDTLKSLNSDYEAKRFNDLAMKAPVIHIMAKGTFYNWLNKKGKLGGQNKVPRLCNDRKILEDILSM